MSIQHILYKVVKTGPTHYIKVHRLDKDYMCYGHSHTTEEEAIKCNNMKDYKEWGDSEDILR